MGADKDSKIKFGLTDDDDDVQVSPGWLCLILKRAVIAYVILFFLLGLLMSAFGSHPLAKSGLMPKGLLLFVGAATIIAVANSLVEHARETGTNWFRLLVNLAFKKHK